MLTADWPEGRLRGPRGRTDRRADVTIGGDDPTGEFRSVRLGDLHHSPVREALVLGFRGARGVVPPPSHRAQVATGPAPVALVRCAPAARSRPSRSDRDSHLSPSATSRPVPFSCTSSTFPRTLVLSCPLGTATWPPGGRSPPPVRRPWISFAACRQSASVPPPGQMVEAVVFSGWSWRCPAVSNRPRSLRFRSRLAQEWLPGRDLQPHLEARAARRSRRSAGDRARRGRRGSGRRTSSAFFPRCI